MRRVGGAGREHDFRIARQLDIPRALAVIGDRHPPQLSIVLGRHDDLGAGFDFGVDAAEHRAIGGEGHFVFVGILGGGLVCRRPDLACLEVADVAEAAPVVGRDVLVPSGQRELLPSAVSAPGVRDHHQARTVREQVRPRAQRVGRGVSAERRHRAAPPRRYMSGGLDRRILERHQLRNPLLQQQLRRLDPRDRRETGAASASRSAGCRARPRLIPWWWAMYVGSDDADRWRRRAIVQACSRSLRSSRSCRRGLARASVRDSRTTSAGASGRREHGGVRRHDQILGEPPLQAEARHTKRAVLVVAASRSCALYADSEMPHGTPR